MQNINQQNNYSNFKKLKKVIFVHLILLYKLRIKGQCDRIKMLSCKYIIIGVLTLKTFLNAFSFVFLNIFLNHCRGYTVLKNGTNRRLFIDYF